jgi:hypothetical protein
MKIANFLEHKEDILRTKQCVKKDNKTKAAELLALKNYQTLNNWIKNTASNNNWHGPG